MGKFQEEWDDTPAAEPMAREEVDRRLALLRECCLVYLKLDFALYAAIGAIVSFVGWRDFELLAALHEYRGIVGGLTLLAAGGLILEWRLTRARFLSRMTSVNPDPEHVSRFLRLFRTGYLLQVWGHMFLLLIFTGYLFGAARRAAELLAASPP